MVGSGFGTHRRHFALCIMDSLHQLNSAMVSDLALSRRSAAPNATGEEVEPTAGANVDVHDATGPNPQGRPAVDGHGRVSDRITLRNNVRLGTWNVRTLNHVGKPCNVTREMRRCDLRVLGIAETHWRGTGHFTTETGELIMYSGGVERRAGVAIILSKEVASSMISYQPVSDRILCVRINASPLNLSLIQIYAPTSDADVEEIEGFYGQLQDAFNRCPRQDVVMVAGDFFLNAKVRANSLDSEVCGRFGLGTPNAAGNRLLDFCYDNHLYITNTAFQHHERLHMDVSWKSLQKSDRLHPHQ